MVAKFIGSGWHLLSSLYVGLYLIKNWCDNRDGDIEIPNGFKEQACSVIVNGHGFGLGGQGAADGICLLRRERCPCYGICVRHKLCRHQNLALVMLINLVELFATDLTLSKLI